MRRVGHESSLADEREIEPVQHVVERVRQLFEFVVRSVEVDPLIEMFLRGASRGAGDLVQRVQDPPADRPSQPAGNDGAANETDQRPQQ